MDHKSQKINQELTKSVFQRKSCSHYYACLESQKQRELEAPDSSSRGGQVSACRIRFKFYLETGNLGGLIFTKALINLSIDG